MKSNQTSWTAVTTTEGNIRGKSQAFVVTMVCVCVCLTFSPPCDLWGSLISLFSVLTTGFLSQWLCKGSFSGVS